MYTGKILQLSQDFSTKKFSLTLEINEKEFGESYDKLKACELLDIDLKKHREKRSLDSNNYAWLLMSKLAQHHRTTKEEIYHLMLERYSAPQFLPIPLEQVSTIENVFRIVRKRGKSKPTTQSGKEVEIETCECYIGSSLFDTLQMSVFIEGIASECKEVKIDTMTPEEIKKMNESWERYKNGK